mmetsp:Transcript_49665/g.88749  ORF Transcript_49665/g.88749 Transcript_49665/m.88749 type:complete len:254 (+) Transcript_49665:688-1449(+)
MAAVIVLLSGSKHLHSLLPLPFPHVRLLDVVQLAGYLFILRTVFIHLSLEVVETGLHTLHLHGLLFQVFFVDVQLLRNLRPRLPRKNAFQLDIELLLLGDHRLLRLDVLCLGDQFLLQLLDPLNLFVRLGLGALELVPPVHVQWVLQLIIQSLHLVPLLGQHLGPGVDVPPQAVNATDVDPHILELHCQLSDLGAQVSDVQQPVSVLQLPFIEHGLLYPYLLIQLSQFIVALDQLRSKDVPFIHDIFVVTLLL